MENGTWRARAETYLEMVHSPHCMDKETATQKGNQLVRCGRDSNPNLYDILSRAASLPSVLFLAPPTLGDTEGFSLRIQHIRN